jgi:transposase
MPHAKEWPGGGYRQSLGPQGERVRELIEEKGCELIYLPPYSPDYNPIEGPSPS